MNILIVSYNWPPRNAMGTHRGVAWANSWSNSGNSVTVLTSKKQRFDGNLDLTDLYVSCEVRVIEVQYLSVVKRALFQMLAIPFINKLAKLVLRINKANSGISEAVRNQWVEAAQDKIDASQFDLVISSFGPEASHLLAAKLKLKHERLFWVADFRDLWSLNPNFAYSNHEMRRSIDRESKVVNDANLISTVSKGFADKLQLQYPDVEVIISKNGHDFEDKAILRNIQSHDDCIKKEEFRIVYTGNYYPNTQLVDAFLFAVNTVLGEPKEEKTLVLEIYGERVAGIQEAQERLGCKIETRYFGHVARRLVLQKQRDADLLLLVESNDDFSGVIPGKVYEYICAGSPILCVGASGNSEIGQIISETGTGLAAGINIPLITTSLTSLINEGRFMCFDPNFNKIIKYSRKKQSIDLLQDIKKHMDIRQP